MNEIERQTQQSIAPEVGERRALQSCAPTCFYVLGRAEGYLQDGEDTDLGSFVKGLDWDNDFSEATGWVRPKLAAGLRGQYGMEIVSWRTGGNDAADDETISKMRAAGYVSSDREVQFYRDHVVGKQPLDVVADGYPIIAGVVPGFGANQDSHAIVINKVEDDKAYVIDPDERNINQIYSKQYVEQNLNPTGGGFTVVLPKES
jgi:hypothetical protein